MVGHSAIVPAIRNTTSIRSNARHRRRLAALAGRSIVDLVVVGDFTAWSPAASGNSRYDESGEEIKGYRKDSRSYGAKAINCRPCSIGRNHHFIQHMSRRGWPRRHDSLGGTVTLKEQRIRRNWKDVLSGQFVQIISPWDGDLIRFDFHSMYKVLGE